jgi:membrane dipeptidase
MTLTWANSNGWADSSGDADDPKVPHTKDGLSDFGKDVVYEMNRLGMMVDISHVSDKTFYRTLIISRAPVIASHSSARALANHPRNMDDNMLRAVGQYGGIVMVNFYSSFLSDDYRNAVKAKEPSIKQAIDAEKAKLAAEGKPVPSELEDQITRKMTADIPRPPLSILIDHIDHVAKIAGIDHVGLGSDFDGIPSSPEGMDSAADLPKITQMLMARGYSAEDMHKILGGNFLKVFEKVQEVSRQLQAQNRPKITEKQPFDKK